METTAPPVKDDNLFVKKRLAHKCSFRGVCEYKRRKLQSDCEAGHADGTPYGQTSHGTNTDDDCCSTFRRKMNKLELLFERFACRRWAAGPAGSATQVASVPGDPAPDVSFPTPGKGMCEKYAFGLPEIPTDAQSISSVGESILSGQDSKWSSASSMNTVVGAANSRHPLGPEYIRRSLIALLPSQEDANSIFLSSNGWTILCSTYRPAKELRLNQDAASFSLDMSAVAKENTLVVARTLLHLAICIQTLPPEFATSSLKHIWSLETAMETYVSTVTDLVLSSDEQMSTLPGLETLLLLVHYHFTTSNFRLAWLTVRRALNLAHLMGLHRIVAQQNPFPGSEVMEEAIYVWRHLVDSDRYLSLHLRLPFASDDYPCFSSFPPTLFHRATLGSIAREISDLDPSITSQSYVHALAIDEKLDHLMKNLSKPHWEIPTIDPRLRTSQAANLILHLATQIWHFELKILLHLPFLLRANTEQRYEYSKVTALQAARNVILRWFALRNARATQTCSRACELPLFIATTTITLDILTEMRTKDRAEVQRSRGADFAMVCRVVGEMEKLARGSPREVVAKRSVPVLKKLLCSLDASRLGRGTMRLTMPYFGTIEISADKPPVKPGESGAGLPVVDFGNGNGNGVDGSAAGVGSRGKGGAGIDEKSPVFSFVSNALWPPVEGGGERECEFDVTLFDGLMDLDVEGNWVF